MGTNLEAVFDVSDSLPPEVGDRLASVSTSASECHGIWYDSVLIIPSVLFVIYLAIHAKKNLKKLYNGRSNVVIFYFALLWFTSLLNLAWCSLQAWQCSTGKEIAWNLLSLFTSSSMLFLEISLVAFLLKESYGRSLEALSNDFIISGILVGADILLKAIYIFGFGVPLFMDGVGSTHRAKWGLWIIHKLLLTAVYGFTLFLHFSKWREKLPPRAAFFNYMIVMFIISALALFACGLATLGSSFGIWFYGLTDVCYHALYLPFLYLTVLADFFQEENFILDDAYFCEMRDAGFFDADWD